MAKPLTWDSPGLKFDTPGLTWDGVEASKKNMSTIKAIIDFSGFSGFTAADLGPKAQTIHDSMTILFAVDGIWPHGVEGSAGPATPSTSPTPRPRRRGA